MLERTSPAINAANLDAFRQGLRDLGYVEGKDFVIEYRSADGRDERFPGLAAELVRLKVDLIVTRGTQAALAAKHATGTIPVVDLGDDGAHPGDVPAGAGEARDELLQRADQVNE
jgi:putative tryptophan/tyrosine transport system substrate-binding protein